MKRNGVGKQGSYDIKNEYIYRSFAKNKAQKENYIINAIYSRINEKELKPVTQQCVRINGKYRKIDLFFPQLDIGIECDEKYHKKQIGKDYNRTIEIKEKLNSIILAKKFREYRIDATLSYEKLYMRINKVAEKIKKRCKNLKWETKDEAIVRLRKQGKITIGDNITYKNHSEVCALFNKKARARRGSDKLNSKIMIWYPKLSIYENGKWIPKHKKWDNRLNDKWNTIYENALQKKEKGISDYNKKCKRLVFARTEDLEGTKGYRFIGVFKFASEKKQMRKYLKISNSFEISKIK